MAELALFQTEGWPEIQEPAEIEVGQPEPGELKLAAGTC